MQPIATFSIVAFDPARQEWGVAVQSKFLACAAVVSWAQADAGAVATQSFANLAYGPQGLALMAQSMPAAEVIAALTRNDPQRESRQVGVVDRFGNAAAFTGAECFEWAGHIVGDGFACQGNILHPGTIEAMAQTFTAARRGPGELADWLVAALAAGQAAGGDQRGRQAAGVLVVRPNGGYGGNTDRYLDLRVDDHPTPIDKLTELVALHHLYFGQPDPNDLIPLASINREVQELLVKTGHLAGPPANSFDEPARKALRKLVGMENLEERWPGDGDMIDRQVVDFLFNKFGG